MRKRLLVLLGLLIFSSITYSQFWPELVPLNGTEFCRGYENQNQARVRMVTQLPNFSNFPDIYTVYTWIAEHPKGTKVWNTTSPERAIPLPWPGEYSIQVKVEFIKYHRAAPNSNSWSTRTVSSFWSNRIKIVARDCAGVSGKYSPSETYPFSVRKMN